MPGHRLRQRGGGQLPVRLLLAEHGGGGQRAAERLVDRAGPGQQRLVGARMPADRTVRALEAEHELDGGAQSAPVLFEEPAVPGGQVVVIDRRPPGTR